MKTHGLQGQSSQARWRHSIKIKGSHHQFKQPQDHGGTSGQPRLRGRCVGGGGRAGSPYRVWCRPALMSLPKRKGRAAAAFWWRRCTPPCTRDDPRPLKLAYTSPSTCSTPRRHCSTPRPSWPRRATTYCPCSTRRRAASSFPPAPLRPNYRFRQSARTGSRRHTLPSSSGRWPRPTNASAPAFGPSASATRRCCAS